MNKKRVLITSLGYVLLGVVYVFLVYWINKNIDCFLDRDLITELTLTKRIADTKLYFQENWFYSTEIRVIYMQLIYVPLFWIFTDWSTILFFGISIWFIILVASFYFLYCRLNLEKCYFPYFAILLLCPLSYEYLHFSEAGNYYMSWISLSFLFCGLLFSVFRTDLGSGVKKVNYLMAILLGFLSSVGGVRMIVCLYLPMLIASVILVITEEKEKIFDLKIEKTAALKFFILNICNIIASGIGYLINIKILAKKYSFSDYTQVGWKSFSFSSVESVIRGWLEYFGYVTGENLFIHRVLRHNIVCAFLILVVLLAVIYGLKKRNILYRCLVLIFSSSVLVSTLLYIFTEMSISIRYLFPFAYLFVPILACLFHDFERKIRIPVLILGEILVLMLCLYIGDYALFKQRISAEDNQEAIEYLLANGLTEGYSTNHNLVYYSNGEIEIWFVEKRPYDSEGYLYIDHWLQPISHSEELPMDGGITFFALSREEYESDIYYQENFKTDDILFENASYLIFRYENGGQVKIIL